MHKTHVISTNAVDRFIGKPDTRKNQFGRQDFALHKIQFNPPEGCRVRILEVHMDLVAKWSGRATHSIQRYSPKLMDSDCWPPSGWGLGGLQTSGPEGSQLASPAAENTIIYRQLEIPGRCELEVSKVYNGRLLDDNALWIKHAVFNVVGGKEIQIETSGEIVFRCE